ncbi:MULTISPECIES: mandelate racemase/muconate lactonizing enzyme family protein [Agrobacterium]|uniref:mandelate racemase/muconate lactonizing enzyme family protein n=1 Tax=Agrobacterium tumefaciens TaxID=358 RepID=UPI000EF18200|nr:hypothetical protein At1D1108_51530 [Agrobacterium tumefaciens]NSY09892.1 mandelate racemase/muconate lactonizing enzyme family protein [Agrobacterium tumefaciens]NSY93416.1 mandelate racemase/muconate lactonizing enzyme family protein [Agrobacterium tumefaciens]
MKITRLRTKVVNVPFRPILTQVGQIDFTTCVLCYLETDQAGLVGEGLIHAVSGRRIAVLDEMVRSLEPLVVGLDLAQGGKLNADSWHALNFLGNDGITVHGLSAVESALWDVRAKACGLNVAHMIGACRSRLPVYASGGLWFGGTLDSLQREAGALVAQGFAAIKLRLAPGDSHDSVARVRAVREAIGPNIGLMVDLAQQLTRKQAIRLGRMLEEFDLEWFEEPIACHDHEGEAEIRMSLETPLASGENVHTHRGILRMLQAGAADVLMPDLQRMGGPSEFLKAGHLCEAFDIPVSSHLFTEMSLPLLATMRNATYLEHMPWFEPVYGEALALDADGCAAVPITPGWGVSFDDTAIERLIRRQA